MPQEFGAHQSSSLAIDLKPRAWLSTEGNIIERTASLAAAVLSHLDK